MHNRLNHRLSGLSIRAAGLVTLGLSWLCGRELWHLHTREVTAVTFLLALMTFLAASAGSAMLVLGSYLFAEVEVSRRWARQPVTRNHPGLLTSAAEPRADQHTQDR